jgi:hypothetical protein
VDTKRPKRGRSKIIENGVGTDHGLGAKNNRSNDYRFLPIMLSQTVRDGEWAL